MPKLESIKKTLSNILCGTYDEMYCERCHQITEHKEESSVNIFVGYSYPRLYRCRVCGMGRQSW